MPQADVPGNTSEPGPERLGSLAVCGKCKQPIAWRRTPKDKMMPLDPEPHEEGNTVVRNDIAVVLKASEQPSLLDPEPRYRPHFATCPGWKR